MRLSCEWAAYKDPQSSLGNANVSLEGPFLDKGPASPHLPGSQAEECSVHPPCPGRWHFHHPWLPTEKWRAFTFQSLSPLLCVDSEHPSWGRISAFPSLLGSHGPFFTGALPVPLWPSTCLPRICSLAEVSGLFPAFFFFFLIYTFMPLFLTSGFLKQPKDNCLYPIFYPPRLHCQGKSLPFKIKFKQQRDWKVHTTKLLSSVPLWVALNALHFCIF